MDALLPTAAEKGLSGVGIKPGRYLPKPLPPAMTEAADRLGLPLLQLPSDMRFTELADAVSREIVRRRIPAEQELLDTLDSWLRCMGNQRRMARELHLHYNTVSYRLQQLWLLLEADPADPMKRLALETALYLYRYRRT